MCPTTSLKYFDCGDIYRWQKDLIYYHLAFSSLNKNAWPGSLFSKRLCPEEAEMEPKQSWAERAEHPQLGQKPRGEGGWQAGEGEREEERSRQHEHERDLPITS